MMICNQIRIKDTIVPFIIFLKTISILKILILQMGGKYLHVPLKILVPLWNSISVRCREGIQSVMLITVTLRDTNIPTDWKKKYPLFYCSDAPISDKHYDS